MGGWCLRSFSYLLQLSLHFFGGAVDSADAGAGASTGAGAGAGAGADDADGRREIALFGFPNAITTLRDIQVQAGFAA